jgi:hypothetical protein
VAPDGLYRQLVLKLYEIGIKEAIQIKGHKQSLDLVVGLYHLVINYKIQGIVVELIGITSKQPDIGVTVHERTLSHGVQIWAPGKLKTIINLLSNVFVPSKQWLIEAS